MINRIKNWFKNPYNICFFGILVFAIIIRFYYFWMTKNQPLWWDESEYMSYAKWFAGKGFYEFNWGGIRLPGYPLLISLFFILGIGYEVLIRFTTSFLPSLLVILLVYVVLSKMYSDKRIALISMAIISVLWEHLFYSNRFHTENFALIFEFLAIFILFFCYIQNKNLWFIKSKYSLLWILLFCGISVIFRPGNLIFIPGLIFFIILLNYQNIFKRKNLYILLLILIIIPILVIILLKMPRTGLLYAFHPNEPLGWNSLTVFYGFYQSIVPNVPSILFFSFIFGLIIFFIELFLYLPLLKNINRKEITPLTSDIFSILLILSVMFFFIFIIRANVFEYRWFFPLLIGMLAFTSKGILTFSDYIGNLLKSKKLVLLIIIIICILGVYTQWYHADVIIKNKLNSYEQVKEAGLWLEQNSDPNDIIITESHPQIAYYSDRKVEAWTWFNNESEFNNFLNNSHPEFLMLSIFQDHPKWAFEWPQNNNNTVYPVRAYFLDSEQKQPALVIYRFI